MLLRRPAAAVTLLAFCAAAWGFPAKQDQLVQEAWQAVTGSFVDLPGDLSEWGHAKQIAIQAASQKQNGTHDAIVEMLSTLHNTRLQLLTLNEAIEVQNELQSELPQSGLTYLSFEFRPHAPPRIITTLRSSEGARAGIKSRDELVTIDGIDTKEVSIGSLLARFKAPNRPLQLEVTRGTQRLKLELKPSEKPDSLKAVSFRLTNDKIGEIQIRQFTPSSGQQVRSAVQELLQIGARRFLIDVRNNPGGFVTAAKEAAAAFIGHNVVFCRVGKDGKQDCEKGKSEEELTAAPVTILVNRGTASAAELFAAAFQRQHRGTVAGCETYGHGLANTLVKLSDGSVLLIPMTRFLRADGEDIEGHGIIPDKRSGAGPCE